MNGNLKFADGVTTGEFTNGVAGEEEDKAVVSRSIAQLVKGVTLVSREAILEKVNVVRHQLTSFPLDQPSSKYLMMLPLWVDLRRLANKNINTNRSGRVGLLHQTCNFC